MSLLLSRLETAIKIIFVSIILLFISNCADVSSSETLVAIKGVDSIIRKSATNYHVYSAKGIGALKLNLAKGDSAKLSFFYAEKKPFKLFEGIFISDYPEGSNNISERLIKSGELSINNGIVFFHTRDTAVNWNIRFIDYYRN